MQGVDAKVHKCGTEGPLKGRWHERFVAAKSAVQAADA